MHLVQLKASQKFSYYLLPIVLAAMGLIPLYFWVIGDTNKYFPSIVAILSGCSLLIIASIIFLKQKNSLKFDHIVCDLDKKTKNKIIRDILREHKWSYVKNEYNFIQADGFGFRDNLDLRTWSELITVVVENDKINVNSICNPDGLFPQAFSFGKNKQNIRDFETLLMEKISEFKHHEI